MENSWVSIKRRLLSPGQEGEAQDEGSETSETSTELENGPLPSETPTVTLREPTMTREILDATGRQSEAIRVGMGQVLERLDEIARLKEDFSALIIDPVTSLVSD